MNEISFGVDTGALKAAGRGEAIKFLTAFDRAQVISIGRFNTPAALWKLKRLLQVSSNLGAIRRESVRSLLSFV
jgi:hypothetical protein